MVRANVTRCRLLEVKQLRNGPLNRIGLVEGGRFVLLR
ncbi:MAG: hypothetical protein AVDCRST_MAG43-1025 [uncultured Thermomicrobiales bacterium]|uniref:Uncharacterized protein n=1 Tax=uncultured Thermomicrobiales bacterium TaxID=1645740 RepID=A0A6J4UH28_9BACT|nr:MAG: hypothetical protein AVDCRST_MAG43-1025 [uncultured Thermomicrobiales bacterium]